MKKITLLLLLFAGTANAQIVNIPDANFKANLIASGLDFNTNGEIDVAEAIMVSYLDVSASGITNMTGIEAFTNLTTLVCYNNAITSLDVTNSPSLQTLYCNFNQLTSLNISGLTNLQKLHCQNNQLTTLDVSGFSNLTELKCETNQLTTLNTSGATGLTDLTCTLNQIGSLDLTGMTNLINLNCSNNVITSLNVNALTTLVDLNCASNQLSSITVGSLTNLKKLNCYNNQITVLNVAGLNLDELDCGYNQIPTLDLATQTNLKVLRCNYNQLNTISFTGLANLETLDCSQNQFSALNFTGLSNLKILSCWNNQLTTLNVNGLTSLENLSCDGNQLTTLDVSTLANLQNLGCAFNQLTTLNVAPLTNLTALNCHSNFITSLDLSNNDGLEFLNCSINQLTSLDVTNLTGLRSLICGNNVIPNVNFSGLTQLYELYVDSTQRTSIDVSNQPLLRTLFCGNNPISVVDLSNSLNMYMASVGGASLTQLFLKNGANEFLNISGGCPNLQVVCADAVQLQQVYNEVMMGGGSGANITSYCTLMPGGNYNTITGLSRFDLTNDGCSVADIPSNNLKYLLTNTTVTEASLVNPSATYAFYTGVGNFTLTPQFENPSYFNISPASATFNFPTVDNSTQTQDFCITANGPHPDLEVVIVPIWAARPGFDAKYQVVYKNKGNQTLSGTVNVVFDDAHTDFVSATPIVDTQTFSSLIWNYADLQPFESRAIEFTININSPLETPSVNDGDILNFTASINFASGDDTPADNVSLLNQIVVNSMDPNAKTCLEGDVISPEKIGQYLHYNIEFENLGTASAANVVVKDVIDIAKFDINSLQVLYASHQMYVTIRNNVAEFVFENINLVAASGNPPVGGHGNVLFKIKTLPTLVTGDHVENGADIYFDYNSGLETNTARTTFQALSIPGHNIDESIVVYPNPTRNNVNIQCSGVIETVELFDIQGRLLRTAIVNANMINLDTSDKSNGIYFLRITSDKGQKVQKLVKE